MQTTPASSASMVGFVSPRTGAPLRPDGEVLVSPMGERVPIVRSIPRFVPSESYTAAFGLQWNLHSQTQLDTLNRNVNDLNVGINTLNYQFAQQTSTIDTAWADLKVALTDKQISDWFNACIDTALSALKITFDAAKLVATGGADLSALKGVITESVGMTTVVWPMSAGQPCVIIPGPAPRAQRFLISSVSPGPGSSAPTRRCQPGARSARKCPAGTWFPSNWLMT